MTKYSMMLVLVFTACGGGGSSSSKTFSSSDPRCTALCTITVPTVDGAGDVCSESSAKSCISLCEARIKGVGTVCASCLLQDSNFGSFGVASLDCSGGSGTTTTCTRTGNGTSCTYAEGDQAAADDCYRKTSPRRTVDCPTEFRDVQDCAASCS